MGNTILGTEEFCAQQSSVSCTFQNKRAEGEVRGQKVTIIDTPGLFDTHATQEEVLGRIKASVSLCAPGPHAFLLVLKLDRFTQEEKDTMRILQSTFGKDMAKYSLVLFTHGDRLKTQTVEQFVDKSGDLTGLVEACHWRYHVFNNQVKDDKQVDELLQKLHGMTLENGGGHYTKEMFRKATKASKKLRQSVIKEMKATEEHRRKILKAEVKREIKLAGRSKRRERCALQ